MGEVYRATDSTLDREVAIKVLQESVAADPDRLARFEREAKTLAALNHANIAIIHSVERSRGATAIVMEFVSGETLAERIARGSLPLDEALTVATQIADALEAAHDKGIVHRDLKPANIKITPDGVVKVLDFGLAKATAGDAPAPGLTHAPTAAANATSAGLILGTPAYMSPEQARGRPVDKRTDVWAFGVVLFEMLTGRRPFDGDSLSDVVAAVLKGDPDWTRLPAGTPVSVRTLLHRALQKDPKRRLRDIADAFITDVEPAAVDRTPDAPVRSWPLALFIAVAMTALAATGIVMWPRSGTVAIGDWVGESLGGPSIAIGPRLSPDGTTIAFQAWVDGLNQVAVMKPETGDWSVLTHDRTSGQIKDLSWSPDGSRIYFDRYLDVPNGVFSIPVVGGEPRPVADDAMYPKALPDGTLLLVKLSEDSRFQLHRYHPDSGRSEPLPAFWIPNQGQPLVAVFPGGSDAAFYGLRADAKAGDPYSLNVMELASGRTEILAPSISITQAAFPGGLAVAKDGSHVLAGVNAADLHRIVAIPYPARGETRTLLTLSSPTAFLDSGPGDTVLADQVVGTSEVIRFAAAGGTPVPIVVIPGTQFDGFPIVLPDRRILATSRRSGRSRLLLAQPDSKQTGFIETLTDSTTPAAALNNDEIVFLSGRGPDRTIAIASLSKARVLRRLEGTRGVSVESLAVSSNRQTIYYASGGTIWAVPMSDGKPRPLHAGNSVAVDPRSGDPIVQLVDAAGVRLVGVTGDGTSRPIAFTSEVLLAPFPLSSNAVGVDGRILVQVTSRDSWFFRPGLVDPVSGRMDRIPLSYEGDVMAPAWDSTGEVVATGSPLRSTIWRFRPTAR